MLCNSHEAASLARAKAWIHNPSSWSQPELLALNRDAASLLPLSGHLGMKTETGRRASPCSVSAGNVHEGLLKFFVALNVSANDHENTANINLGVTSKLLQVGGFTNKESLNNEMHCSLSRWSRKKIYIHTHTLIENSSNPEIYCLSS